MAHGLRSGGGRLLKADELFEVVVLIADRHTERPTVIMRKREKGKGRGEGVGVYTP